MWKKLFEMLASDADNEYAMIDSTIVRALSTVLAHKKRRRKPSDRTQQGGLSPVYALVDALGNPLASF